MTMLCHFGLIKLIPEPSRSCHWRQKTFMVAILSKQNFPVTLFRLATPPSNSSWRNLLVRGSPSSYPHIQPRSCSWFLLSLKLSTHTTMLVLVISSRHQILRIGTWGHPPPPTSILAFISYQQGFPHAQFPCLTLVSTLGPSKSVTGTATLKHAWQEQIFIDPIFPSLD